MTSQAVGAHRAAPVPLRSRGAIGGPVLELTPGPFPSGQRSQRGGRRPLPFREGGGGKCDAETNYTRRPRPGQ